MVGGGFGGCVEAAQGPRAGPAPPSRASHFSGTHAHTKESRPLSSSAPLCGSRPGWQVPRDQVPAGGVFLRAMPTSPLANPGASSPAVERQVGLPRWRAWCPGAPLRRALPASDSQTSGRLPARVPDRMVHVRGLPRPRSQRTTCFRARIQGPARRCRTEPPAARVRELSAGVGRTQRSVRAFSGAGPAQHCRPVTRWLPEEQPRQRAECIFVCAPQGARGPSGLPGPERPRPAGQRRRGFGDTV